VLEEQVEQVQEEEANQVDPEPGRLLEDGQVDWDTLIEQNIRLYEKYSDVLHQLTMIGAGGKGTSGGGGKSFWPRAW
jgi:hypothetical protein